MTLTKRPGHRRDYALWARSTKNPDVSTGSLVCPFIHSLAPLTRLLATPCSLYLRALLRSLVCSLAQFGHSQARGTVNDKMAIHSVFFCILGHSAGETAAELRAAGRFFQLTIFIISILFLCRVFHFRFTEPRVYMQ